MTEPIVVPLSNPLAVGDQQVSELHLRPPSIYDLDRLEGSPLLMTVNEGGLSVQINYRKMTHLIAVCADVASDIIAQMDTKDWHTAAWELMPFLVPQSRE